MQGSCIESITKSHKQEVLGLKDTRVGEEYLTNAALSKEWDFMLESLESNIDSAYQTKQDSILVSK